MTLRPRRQWRVLQALAGGPALVLCIPLLLAAPASAHPLDVYLQATYLTVSPTAVTVEMDLSPGVLVAPRVLRKLDANSDHKVSEMEAGRYLGKVVQDVLVRVDGQPTPLSVTTVHVPPYPTIQAGYGTLRIFATTPRIPVRTGQHRVFVRNGFSDAKATYQINAFVAEGAPIVLGNQRRDATQREATVSYRVDASAAVSGQNVTDAKQAQSASETSGPAGYLESRSMFLWITLLALGATTLLGAWHARRRATQGC